MLRIGVLGRLSLELDGQQLAPPVGRPAKALLGWLALHPGTHSRAMVAARLWPDVLDESARGSLRVALVDLRRALAGAADQALLATREQIGLFDSPELEVDARRFRRLLDHGMTDQALELWRGELLEGVEAGDWLVALRDEYRDLRSQALAALGSVAEARGDTEQALRWARARVALEAGRGSLRRGARVVSRAHCIRRTASARGPAAEVRGAHGSRPVRAPRDDRPRTRQPRSVRAGGAGAELGWDLIARVRQVGAWWPASSRRRDRRTGLRVSGSC